jgi:hypothetical protein
MCYHKASLKDLNYTLKITKTAVLQVFQTPSMIYVNPSRLLNEFLVFQTSKLSCHLILNVILY